jgi:anti-sigma factor RsiW
MDTCTKPAIRRRLTAYVDGELAPRDAAEVRAHLGTCPGCRGAMALDLRIARAMRALPEWEAPASVTEAVLARTVLAPATGYRRLARWLPALRIAVPSALVLSLLIVLKVSGVIRAAVSLASIAALAAARSLPGFMETTADTLGPLSKLVEFGHADRVFTAIVRALVAAPPVELAAAVLLATLILVFVGLRIAGSRAPRGVGHAALFV